MVTGVDVSWSGLRGRAAEPALSTQQAAPDDARSASECWGRKWIGG